MISQINNSSVLDAALEYAKRGWQVIPLHSIDADGNCTCNNTNCTSVAKHPIYELTPNGLKNATTDEETLRKWFTNQNRNIGIVTGKESGIVVLDVDYKNGGNDGLYDLSCKTRVKEFIETTIKANTGNGNHYYYNYTPLKNSASKLGQGLDIRGDGGYVVAPPSIHANGKFYEFAIGCNELADFPTEWLTILQSHSHHLTNGNGNGHSNGNGLVIPAPMGYQVPEKILDGTRHDSFVAMAGKLHHDGFPVDVIEDVLLKMNQKIMQTPAMEADVRKIVQRVTRTYAPGVVYENKITDETILNWDDVSIAKLFAKDYSDKLRFNPESKKWFIWTGTHWQMDKTDRTIQWASEFSQNLYTRINDLAANNHKEAQKQIFRSNLSTGLNAFLNLSKSYLSISSDVFDRDPYLFNCKNGTINLKTGQISAHSSEKYLTNYSPFEINADCPFPEFEKFLQTTQPFEDVRKFIQRSIGYSMLGVARERAFWILNGSGNNGKSIFIDLFSRLFGSYASSTTSSSIMKQKADHIPNDIARLKGKRLAVIPETAENERINAPLLKALSAGDTVTARYLFAEYFDFEFSAKIWIATNHKPTITDHSKGFWDRLKIIPFTVDIPKQHVIKRDDLLTQLTAEAPGILAWAVRGVQEYFAGDDLQVPERIQKEIEIYKYEQDSIAQFLDECCEKEETYQTNNGDLYKKYCDFCKDTGEYQKSQRSLTLKLKERGFEQGNNYGTRYWRGLRLK